MEVKIAVISDLHCHPETALPLDSFLLCERMRRPAREHPIESLLELIRERKLSADALLVTGDITNKANKQGIISGWNFIKEVSAALSVSELVATVGNHDIDSRGLHSEDPFMVAKSFSPDDFPVSSAAARDDFWERGFCFVETDSLCVLVVNSVLHHYSEAETKRGKINDAQLERLERELEDRPGKAFRVALIHHHPIPHENLKLGADDLVVKGSELLDVLEKARFRIVVHGHKHYPRLRYASGGGSAPTVFASGSLSAFNAQMLSNTRNLFHIIRLCDEPIPGCVGQGKIESFEFNAGKGWSPPSKRSADFPAIAGFGCRSSYTDLAESTIKVLGASSMGLQQWAAVQVSLPQVEYLLPGDFELYSKELESRFRVKMYPAPPEIPYCIGRTEGGE